MLLITRRETEAIVINGSITVKVLEVRGGRVKLGFEFPAGSTVFREELFAKIQAENQAAAVGTKGATDDTSSLTTALKNLQTKLNKDNKNDQHPNPPKEQSAKS